ncbi:MAG: helix-turn-helix domain-containing protein [archaeon]
MEIKQLQEAGLTNTEARIYLVLLELGSGLAGEITKKSELNRTIVYYSLNKLIEKGLVSYVIEANRKVFKPVNPERLIEIMEEKEKNMREILPGLKKKFESKMSESDAEIYRGRKGLKSIFEDILRTGKDYMIFGAEGRFEDVFPDYFHLWNKKRVERKIKVRVVYNEKARQMREGKLKFVEMRFLPKELDFPSTTQIYGGKVSIMVWSKPEFAFVIKSKEAVKSYMNFFELLWKVGKK